MHSVNCCVGYAVKIDVGGGILFLVWFVLAVDARMFLTPNKQLVVFSGTYPRLEKGQLESQSYDLISFLVIASKID